MKNKSTSRCIFLTVTFKKTFSDSTLFVFFYNFFFFRIITTALHIPVCTHSQSSRYNWNTTLTMLFFSFLFFSPHNLIFLHMNREPSGDLWMDVNTVNVRWRGDRVAARLLLCNCHIVSANNKIPLSSRKQNIFRDHYHSICTFLHHKHWYLYKTMIPLSNDPFPTTVRLNAGIIHVPSSNTSWLVTLMT